MLDEASTALHLPAEIQFLNGICQFLQEVTPLFVSHRLANTDLMGHVLVFHRGTIVEDGRLLALRRAGSIHTDLLRTSQGGNSLSLSWNFLTSIARRLHIHSV
jgi:ABC-type transport system involved in cytochrome bd biosynthesis fused ATPase/permease subunit